MSYFETLSSLKQNEIHILRLQSQNCTSEKRKQKEKFKGGMLLWQIVHLMWRQYRKQKVHLTVLKMEVASELGVPLTDGYNGNLTSKQNGSVGGYMVKKMIEAQERQMSGGAGAGMSGGNGTQY